MDITAIKFCLTLIVVQSYEALIILRHPTTDNGTKRKLTCVSGDDDGALIWNYNFENPDLHSGKSIFTNFEPEKPPSNKVAECALWKSKQCFAKWKTTGGWEVIDSASKPMGPVLDYRWENFTQYYHTEKYQHVRVFQESSGTAVFSVRGISDVYILLCEKAMPTEGPCFAIVIGGSKGTRSAIRTCGGGVSDSVQSMEDGSCKDLFSVTHGAEEVIHVYEWRTFTMKWSGDKKEIQLFKETDERNEPFLKATVDQWGRASNLIVGSQIATRFRFHFYYYLRTEEKDSVISTVEFDQVEENLCIEMLVGLCPECKLNVSLINEKGRSLKTWSISDNGKSIYNELLNWQSVKRSINLKKQVLKLEIQTILNSNGEKGQWAIDTFRTCNSLDEYRKSTITAVQETSGVSFWHEASCQKLSYKESTVVKSRSETTISRDTKKVETLIEGCKKSCGSSCENLGKYWSFCDTDGCTCDQEIDCHERSGVCCEKFSDALLSLAPDVRGLRAAFVSTTKVSLEWKIVPRNTGNVNYNVSIKLDKMLGCEDLGISTPPQKEIVTTVNDTKVSIDGLHPYANYTATVTTIPTESGKSETVIFRTRETDIPTSAISNLRLDDRNLTLQWDEPENCTTITGPRKATRLIFAGVSDSVRNWTDKRQTSFNHFFLRSNPTSHFRLDPFTWYNVRVYVIRGNNLPENSTAYRTVEWRTPPAVPPAVTDLKITRADPDTNTVFLRWTAPNPPNGEIESYQVSILQENKEIYKKFIKGAGKSSNYEITLPSNLQAIDTQFRVSAINKEVKEPGAPCTVQFNPFLYFNVPRQPLSLKAHPQAHGIVNLTWMYPSISHYRIRRFFIKVKVLKSNLYSDRNHHLQFNCSASRERKKYFKELHLLTSTSYQISLMAINIDNSGSSPARVNITVPDGYAFVSGRDLQIKKKDKMIELKIPGVENATRNSVVSVKVTGSMRCSQKQSQTSSLTSEPTEWTVTRYNPEGKRFKSLPIDLNEGLKPNCSLQLEETYIKVILGDGELKNLTYLTSPALALIDDEQNYLPWLIISLVIAICVLLVCLLVVLLVRRRQSKRIPRQPREPSYLEIIPLHSTTTSQNNLTILETAENSIFLQGATEIRRSVPLYAIPDEPDSCAVSLKYFEEYAKKAAANGLLNSQFMLLPKGLTKPCDCGSLPENIPKNRYKNLIAYDHTRVVLEKIPSDPYSDYINASYIKGYLKERAYIAAQGPKPNTVNDFWRMIWQEDVRVICMLVNVVEGVRTMCQKYWPDVGTRVNYGEFLISNTSNQVFAHYTFRTFKLSYRQETREVTHLHYTGWPIIGVPSSQSLVEYMKKLFQTPAGNGPVVVHCDTGNGRTGTVILCDICLRQAIAERIIDVTAVITRMRDSRANMVGTPQQYLLAHIIISESLVSIPTQIPCTENLSKRIEKMQLQLPTDLQRLDDTMWQEETLDLFATLEPLDELVAESVAVSNSDVSRTLERKSNQISATSVDGVKTKNQYLASWLPPPLSLYNFWKFIAEESIKLIIILQCSDLKNPTCCDILPNERILLSMPDVHVKTETTLDNGEYFTTEKLLLTETSKKNMKTQSVTVLTCKGWEQGKNRKPPTPAALVSLWRASEKIPRKVGQTLVLCHDGITGCGLYLALSYVLERMAVDRECDVISAVRTVRRSNSEFVQSKEQCEYLYDAAKIYAEYFQCYANFT